MDVNFHFCKRQRPWNLVFFTVFSLPFVVQKLSKLTAFHLSSLNMTVFIYSTILRHPLMKILLQRQKEQLIHAWITTGTVICLYVFDDVLNEWHYVSGIWPQKQIRHHLLHPLQAVLSYPTAGPCLWATFAHDSLSHPHPTPIIY